IRAPSRPSTPAPDTAASSSSTTSSPPWPSSSSTADHQDSTREGRSEMSTSPSKAQLNVRKHFSSSFLLWVRSDQPRQTGMDYWKGPHSKIASATPGLQEHRQIHLPGG